MASRRRRLERIEEAANAIETVAIDFGEARDLLLNTKFYREAARLAVELDKLVADLDWELER